MHSMDGGLLACFVFSLDRFLTDAFFMHTRACWLDGRTNVTMDSQSMTDLVVCEDVESQLLRCERGFLS